jgi:putative spermidine/putrescine transport system substrate-binding protein
VGAVAVLGLWGLGPDRVDAQAQVLVVSTYGGSWMDAAKKAYGEPFERETGWQINWVAEVPAAQFAKLKAMKETGHIERDVVEIEGRNFFRGRDLGYFEPVDYAAVPVKDYIQEAVDQFGIGSQLWGYGLAWSTRNVSADRAPKTWPEAFDVNRVPGRRGAFVDAWGNLEAALLADGVPRDKLYPLDVERALRKFDQIKRHITWWKGGAHHTQLLVDGEVDVMSPGLPHRAFAAKTEGARVEAIWHHGLLTLERFVVVAGTKKRDAAMKFLAAVARPENQAKFSLALLTGPSNQKAYDHIPADKRGLLATAPAYRDTVVFLDNKWWAQNAAQVEERWQSWKLK